MVSEAWNLTIPVGTAWRFYEEQWIHSTAGGEAEDARRPSLCFSIVLIVLVVGNLELAGGGSTVTYRGSPHHNQPSLCVENSGYCNYTKTQMMI